MRPLSIHSHNSQNYNIAEEAQGIEGQQVSVGPFSNKDKAQSRLDAKADTTNQRFGTNSKGGLSTKNQSNVSKDFANRRSDKLSGAKKVDNDESNGIPQTARLPRATALKQPFESQKDGRLVVQKEAVQGTNGEGRKETGKQLIGIR